MSSTPALLVSARKAYPGLQIEQVLTGNTLNTQLLVQLRATRGDHGGWADRGLRVLGWLIPNNDDEEFELMPGQQVDDLETITDASDKFRNALSPGVSNEYRLMEEEMYSTPDDEALAARTKTFVGQFTRSEQDWLFVSRDGTSYGIFNEPRYPLETDFVVRGQIFEHPEARHDWLRIMDVFMIED